MKFRLMIAAALLCAAGAIHAQSLGVNLAWSASADSKASNPGSVQVYRAPGTCAANPTSGNTYAEITPSAPAAGPYQDATVTDGATYCYYLTASDSAHATPSSPSVTAQVTVVLGTGPAPPTGLTLTVVQLTSNAANPAATSIRKPAAPKVRQQ